MTTAHTAASTARKPLRLWPGVVAAVLMVLARWVVPVVMPDAALIAVFFALVCALAIIVWWLFFSRARWLERVGAVIVMVLAVLAASRFVHVSIRTGMMGNMLPVSSAFVLPPALVLWAVATRRVSDGLRRVLMVVTIFAAVSVFALLRTDGIIGGRSQLSWRWTPTAEERLLAQVKDEPAPIAAAPPAANDPATAPAPGATGTSPAPPAATTGFKPVDPAPAVAAPAPKPGPAPLAVAVTAPEWPGFRGANRDGVIRGVRIETDWSKSPPAEIWRRPIGPAWSSFAVEGDRIYTQEQRGDSEIVSCYSLSTGKPLWMHRDATRFWESNAGAGPRATPTLSNGRVYSFGGTGILNVLDARSGALVWSRNVAAESNTNVPMWGFSSSPLVKDDVVIVAAAGTLAGYDVTSGKLRWVGPKQGFSYSSPHLVTIDSVAQVLLLAPPGAISVSPADGKVLWEHTWEGGAIVQPAVLPDGEILINSISMMGGLGIRRLAVKRERDTWTTTERWTSNGLKPYFNDFVVHKGHAFGFDGSILSSIDLADGKRKWKGGRYGDGQLVLLADQDVLLVLSEEGDLALVSATPDKFTEIARVPAIEGKTWNHPVIVRDVLLVRNGEEMVAFRLALAGR